MLNGVAAVVDFVTVSTEEVEDVVVTLINGGDMLDAVVVAGVTFNVGEYCSRSGFTLSS